MFVKHNSGVFRLIVTQIIHLISILVDIYTGINVIAGLSEPWLRGDRISTRSRVLDQVILLENNYLRKT